MKILTITCHDVYNVGASLQAYALQQYFKSLGHDTELINFKPDYLRHYRLLGVNNPGYDKPILREIYQILKFPSRVRARGDKRKKAFDEFTRDYLNVGKYECRSAAEIDQMNLEAGLLVAGSDQIWNPVFKNGKDPAFFLQFRCRGARRISYAASFAVESIEQEHEERMKPWLEQFDAISVRERSGIEILKRMRLSASVVCDPVFLINEGEWKKIAIAPDMKENYLFVYDFDQNEKLSGFAKKIAKERNLKIVSVFNMDGADHITEAMGPREFLGWILSANTVISNSFHATAFSVIFEKDFYVMRRTEAINTRMEDLLKELHLESRFVNSSEYEHSIIDWNRVRNIVEIFVDVSKEFLDEQLREAAV